MLDKIIEVCEEKIQQYSEEYKKRLEQEIKYLRIVKVVRPHIVENIHKQIGKKIKSNKSGSLILFLLDVSIIDPIKYKLPLRTEMTEGGDYPDIDLDFHPKVRDWVKEHVVETFGEKKTCSIGTYLRYKTKAVIIDVARALGLDVWKAMGVTKNLDARISTEEKDEETFIDKLPFEDLYESFPELKKYFEENPDVLRHAKILRNQVKNMGKHAGGMIISDLNLHEYVPVFRDKDGSIVSTWAEGQAVHELSTIGLVKFDILGLCLEENTLIKTDKGDIPIKYVDDFSIEYLNENGDSKYTNDFLLTDSGERDLIEIILEDGERIKCTKEHKFFIL